MERFNQFVLNEAFTRQHYQAVADILKREYQFWESGSDGKTAVHNIAQELVSVFKRDNPNFDSGRFLKACGI